jgi:hypothetical protein
LPEPVPVEEIVTWPLPLNGDIVIFGPANICVTPPLSANDAYDAVKANDELITLFDPKGPNTLEAVMNDDVNACEALIEYDAVPNKEPVNEPLNIDAVTALVTYKEFKLASEPLTRTFFQFGITIILFYIAVRYIHLCRVYAYFPIRANNIP